MTTGRCGYSRVTDCRGSLATASREAFDTTVTEAWNLAVETVVASSRVLFGDEGNDQAELDGYGVANLRSSYRLGENLELFVRVDNLFDAEYTTFGVLAELEIDLHEVPDASGPWFVAPGVPRSAFAGVRFRF